MNTSWQLPELLLVVVHALINKLGAYLSIVTELSYPRVIMVLLVVWNIVLFAAWRRHIRRTPALQLMLSRTLFFMLCQMISMLATVLLSLALCVRACS